MVGGTFASLFRLLITITNCLDLDQARLENAGPDVDPNCLTLLLTRGKFNNASALGRSLY